MTKLKDINWNQVYYFYEVARKMSMKEAAEVTGVSIPTVSEQIKRLETLLETLLFNRRPRRIELTTEGETLYKYAKQMFESGLRFLDVVSPTTIGGYPVRIGLQDTFSQGPALEFVMRYFESYAPFGTIHTFREWVPDRLLDRVINGELDWAISLQQPTSPRLEYGKIGSSEVVFCASAELVERFQNRTELFAAVPLARGRWDEQLNKLINDHLNASDIFVEEVIESDQWELCIKLAEQGKCVTVVGKSFTGQQAFNSQNLRTFALGGPIVLPFYAFWRQSSGRMIAIRKLVEILEKEHRGARPRPGGPAPIPGGTGVLPGAAPSGQASSDESEGVPIELPHYFDSDFPKIHRTE